MHLAIATGFTSLFLQRSPAAAVAVQRSSYQSASSSDCQTVFYSRPKAQYFSEIPAVAD
jgi:hypothetical protein